MKSPPLSVHVGMECRPTLVSVEHLLSLGESGACYHGDVEELMGWNFSQGWLWDSTVALRHWKQKGTARPLRVTTKASLWALAYRSLLLGLPSHHWVVPSATTCCLPFLFREEIRQGDVREMSSGEEGGGTWRREARVRRTNAHPGYQQSPSGPIMPHWKSVQTAGSQG